MQIAAQSEIGNIRKENEDRYFISADKKTIAIADGMGGHEKRKIAGGYSYRNFCSVSKRNREGGFFHRKICPNYESCQ